MNPFNIVETFEKEVAKFTGSPYAVAVDSCTSALFLSLTWHRQLWEKALGSRMEQGSQLEGKLLVPPPIQIPKHTFISVPTTAIQAEYQIQFHSRQWKGWYRLDPLPIWDSATRFQKGMFQTLIEQRVQTPSDWGQSGTAFVCLSFQYRKHLPIGRGGMILHNKPDFDDWVRKARFYGRSPCSLEKDPGPEFLGWRKYMTPDEAARGLCFLHRFEEDHDGKDLEIDYPDLSRVPAFQPHTVT